LGNRAEDLRLFGCRIVDGYVYRDDGVLIRETT